MNLIKKSIIGITMMLMAVFCFAGEITNDLADKTEIIIPEYIDTDIPSLSAAIFYTKEYDEVRLICLCRQEFYTEEDMTTTVRDILKNFMVENKYYSYKRIEKDTLQFNESTAVYTVTVKFYR